MDRDEAIEWLRAKGVNASKRDWSLGASIFIPVGSAVEGASITHYTNVFYLYPGTDGSWVFLDTADSRSHTPYPDLQSAAQAALDALRRTSNEF